MALDQTPAELQNHVLYGVVCLFTSWHMLVPNYTAMVTNAACTKVLNCADGESRTRDLLKSQLIQNAP